MGASSLVLHMLEQPVFGDMSVGDSLQVSDALGACSVLEQMREAPLQFEIFVDRHRAADFTAAGDDTIFGFEYGKQSAFDRQPRQADRVVRGRAPAERTRHVDVNV